MVVLKGATDWMISRNVKNNEKYTNVMLKIKPLAQCLVKIHTPLNSSYYLLSLLLSALNLNV